jgi:hypothetical protein
MISPSISLYLLRYLILFHFILLQFTVSNPIPRYLIQWTPIFKDKVLRKYNPIHGILIVYIRFHPWDFNQLYPLQEESIYNCEVLRDKG